MKPKEIQSNIFIAWIAIRRLFLCDVCVRSYYTLVSFYLLTLAVVLHLPIHESILCNVHFHIHNPFLFNLLPKCDAVFVRVCVCDVSEAKGIQLALLLARNVVLCR